MAIKPKNKDALEGLKNLLQKKRAASINKTEITRDITADVTQNLNIKKQIAKGFLSYALLMLVIILGLQFSAGVTAKHIDAQIPKAESQVRTITKLEKTEKSSVMADFTQPHQTTETKTNTETAAIAAPIATFDPADKKPKIAIIMTGAGLKSNLTDEAIAILPSAINFAFSPYSAALPEFIKKASENEHQSLLMLPLEPEDFPRADPGPLGLLLKYSPEENVHKLNELLQKAKPIVGTIPHMGSAFLKNNIATETLISALNEEGLLFINTENIDIANELVMTKAYLKSDLEIDALLTAENIQENLNKISTLAIERGYAIAHIQMTPLALKILPEWIKKIEQENKITLVPITLMPEVMRRVNNS